MSTQAAGLVSSGPALMAEPSRSRPLRLNGEPLGTTGLPGAITQKLIDGFSRLAGFAIVVQAKTQAGIN
ncbi:MAG: hypothetical protein V3T93_00500 [Alphaproteobacteria bacterium]